MSKMSKNILEFLKIDGICQKLTVKTQQYGQNLTKNGTNLTKNYTEIFYFLPKLVVFWPCNSYQQCTKIFDF